MATAGRDKVSHTPERWCSSHQTGGGVLGRQVGGALPRRCADAAIGGWLLWQSRAALGVTYPTRITDAPAACWVALLPPHFLSLSLCAQAYKGQEIVRHPLAPASSAVLPPPQPATCYLLAFSATMTSTSSTPTPTTSAAQDGTGVVKIDPWLEPWSEELRHRYAAFTAWVDTINKSEGGLANFARGHTKLGFQVAPNGNITYREWAPNAVTAHLMGDFSITLSPPLDSVVDVQTIGTAPLCPWSAIPLACGPSPCPPSMAGPRSPMIQKSR